MVPRIAGIRHVRNEVGRGAGVPIVRGRDLAATPLTREALTSFAIDEPIPGRVRLVEGDVLIQRIGTSPRIVIPDRDLVGTAVGDTIFILRPKTEQADSWARYHFMRSQAGQTLLAGRRGGSITISSSALRSIPVPVFGLKVSQELESLRRVEHDLRARADRLESMRLGLFNAESPEQLKAQLRDARHTASALVSSVEQAESLQYQLRNLYPFPLVYPYRSLESRIDPNELYEEELRVAENILAFLGSLGLALIDAGDSANTDIDPAAIWRAGISPGHWWGQVFRPAANVLHSYAGSDLASSIASLTTKRQRNFGEAIHSLIQA